MEMISKLREQRGWSQEELAKRLGVKQPTVANWETGARTPLYRHIEKMASVFNASKAYIMGETGGKHGNKTSTSHEKGARNTTTTI